MKYPLQAATDTNTMAVHWFFLFQGPSPMIVRYVYAVLFLLANLSAWLTRENGISYFISQRVSGGCHGDRGCLAAEAVLVMSQTFCLFFFIMLLSTVCTTKVDDPRNSWHRGWWPVKIALVIGCFSFSVLLTSAGTQIYGKIAQVGAGLFLVLQLVSTIKFITQLNYKLCVTNFEERYLWVAAISATAVIISMGLIIFMTLKFAQCWHNMEVIVITLVLFFIMCVLSLMSKANKFFMEPALIGGYATFICLLAMTSEPESGCGMKSKAGPGAGWLTISFFVSGLLSTVYSAFTMGTGYKCTRSTVESEDDVPYGYGFFHFIFSAGCMYFGMMFVAWDTHHTMEEWNVDIGWISTWVHIASEALVVVSYLTILLARILGVGWLQHFLAKIFGTDDQPHNDESHTTTDESHMMTVHGDEPQTTTVHGDEPQTTTVHGDESHTTTVHGDEPQTTTVHGDESHTTTVHGDESQATTTNDDESETMNTHVTSPSSLYHTASPSSLYYSPEQSPTNNTDHQPPPPSPPSLSPPHTIELQMSEVPNIGTSGMNEEDGDDYIREWESE
ncbi:Serinc-domain containing serine and sphingolipid biosynthesis protein [Zea mays]|uniref:Serinc-domain containing serine and sphingolipid biosynthesis protein n=2 Tax=Zea mays TaxID=4577 RepID=A0A1D6LS53_MAIZE|nr:Serinc-domain containing serine and sphingolipid biosynthesis protein [Zea mays]